MREGEVKTGCIIQSESRAVEAWGDGEVDISSGTWRNILNLIDEKQRNDWKESG